MLIFEIFCWFLLYYLMPVKVLDLYDWIWYFTIKGSKKGKSATRSKKFGIFQIKLFHEGYLSDVFLYLQYHQQKPGITNNLKCILGFNMSYRINISNFKSTETNLISTHIHLHELFERLTLSARCIPDSCIKIKLTLLSDSLKSFLKAFKAFTKPFEGPKRSLKIRPGSGRERLRSRCQIATESHKAHTS